MLPEYKNRQEILDLPSLLKPNTPHISAHPEQHIQFPIEHTIKTSDFLGFFQPHNLDKYSSIDIARQLYTLKESVTPAREQKRLILFGLENQGHIPKRFEHAIEAFIRNPDNPNNPIPSENLMNALRSLGRKDSSAQHLLFCLDCFFTLRGSEPKPKKNFGAFIEKNVPIDFPSEHVVQLANELRSVHVSIEKKYVSSRDFISWMVLRDLRFAGQILERKRKNPNAFFVIFRGTLHLGLVGALGQLSHDFSDIDMSRPIPLSATNLTGLFLPVLWNQQFWREICEQNNITLESTKNDFELKRIAASVKQYLDTNSWKEHLLAQLAKHHLGSTRKNIILSQTLPE